MSKRRALSTNGSGSKKSKNEMEAHLDVLETDDSKDKEMLLLREEIDNGVEDMYSFVVEKETTQGDNGNLLQNRSRMASDKLRESLNDILDSSDDTPSKIDAIGMTADAVGTVVGSLDNLKSGDPGLVAIGVIDILGSISQFAALTGPQGMIVAAVLGPICSIVSSILGAIFMGDQDPPESDEEMLRRVMQELLDKQVSEELKNNAVGVQHELRRMINYATGFLEAGVTGIDDFELQMILDDAYHSVGNRFLGMLQGYIKQRHSDLSNASSDEEKEAKLKDLVVLYDAYASVMFLRVKLLTMLSSLYKCFPNLKVVSQITFKEAEDEKKSAYTVLKFLFQKPTEVDEELIKKIRLRSKTWLSPYEGSTCKRLYGSVVNLYNCTSNEYFHGVWSWKKIIQAPDAREFIVKYDDEDPNTFQLMHFNGKDVIGGVDQQGAKMKLKITSVDYGWGNICRMDGTIRIPNSDVFFNEVHRGRVSSFVNVGTSHYVCANNWKAGMKLKSDVSCRFYFVKKKDGFYNIKSIINLQCLNGGVAEVNPGIEVYSNVVGPESADNWKWRIIKETANENKYYLQSKASGLYLSSHQNGTLRMKDKIEHNENFLWKIYDFDNYGNSTQLPEEDNKVGEQWTERASHKIGVLGWNGWYGKVGSKDYQKVNRDGNWHKFLVDPFDNGKLKIRNEENTTQTQYFSATIGTNGFNAVQIKHMTNERKIDIQCYQVPQNLLTPTDPGQSPAPAPHPTEKEVGDEWIERSSHDIHIFGWEGWNGKVGNAGWHPVTRNGKWQKFEVNPFNNGYIQRRNKDDDHNIRGLFHHDDFNAIMIRHPVNDSRKYYTKCFKLTWS